MRGISFPYRPVWTAYSSKASYPTRWMRRCRAESTALKNALKSTITDVHTSYFRQAVRANELFFEVRVASLYEPGVTEKLLG